MLCVSKRTCCNSEQSTPQAPHLGHRKPLQGSTPTCRDKQEKKFSCTLRTDCDVLLQLETPDLFTTVLRTSCSTWNRQSGQERPYLVVPVHTSRTCNQTASYSSMTLPELDNIKWRGVTVYIYIYSTSDHVVKISQITLSHVKSRHLQSCALRYRMPNWTHVISHILSRTSSSFLRSSAECRRTSSGR